MTEALLKTGQHKVTAITRVGSENELPEGVIAKKVDYSRPETIVEALKGHDVLVITLSAFAPKEVDMLLINAAGEAGVPWILPNEWGPDNTDEGLVKDVSAFQSKGWVTLPLNSPKMRSLIAIIHSYRRDSESHRGPWQELLHCCHYRFLV